MNKIVYKGKYSNPDQLGKGVLPENAVKFKEPETPAQLNLLAILYMIPLIIIILFFSLLRSFIQPDVIHFPGFGLLGIILSLLFILPHEFIHAMVFPKGAVVDLWFVPKQMIAFVHSPVPMSKKRFIILCLLPSLILGILPLSIWTFSTLPAAISKQLFTFGAVSLLMGSGDLMNFSNALRQMPKGSVQQLHGFNSYWYTENKTNN